MLRQTVPSTGSSNRKARSPTVDSRVRRTFSDSEEADRRMSKGLKIGRILELIGEIRRCCPVQTLVHENSELELNLHRCSQPVQLVEERSDVVVR